jgi:glucose/arabinose dehydrogenase
MPMQIRSGALCLAAALTLGSVAAPLAAEPEIRTRRIATGFNFPVGVYHAPGDHERLFVVEKPGRIQILMLGTGQVLPTPFLTITGLVGGGTSTSSEQGLLGLAFHPNYAKNGQFFVNYTATNGATTIRRYTVNPDNPNQANLASGTTLLTIAQPFSNHNGGWIGFGPDGYLYIATGDGGSGNDPGNRAQSIGAGQLLGKILRIDVDGGTPFAIPADNPFANGGGDARIWSWGLRNPWRCSFDRETGDLWIADVGQSAREEINLQPAGVGGQNYGWRCMEGNACTGLSGCTCNSAGLTMPVHTYTYGSGANQGRSITGGVVYRGCAIPELQGTYFFADYVVQRIWSFRYENGAVTNFQSRLGELGTAVNGGTVAQIVAFGEDAQGEVYIVRQGGGSNGEIFKIVPLEGDAPCPPDGIVGDLNGDGVVNGADLGILLGSWGPCPGKGPCVADLDGDGQVAGSDLAIMLGNWGK